VEILSGLRADRTTGAPICGLIHNTDARSRDYDAKLRPGHADWTAFLKFGGHADMRGGGHFSGRLTAPLVFAGAMAKQILARRNVEIYARIAAIGAVAEDDPPCTPQRCADIARKPFPASDPAAPAMQAAIRAAREEEDSVGGIVAAAAFGVPGGLGDPFFSSLESVIASLLFSVPAVKGVEFGDGFRLAALRGSVANDAICVEGGVLRSRTNHNGGILGGIANGMPLVVRAAFKPTPSIGKLQHTVDAADLRPADLRIQGRHDPCIVLRATPVVEACLALGILDCMGPAGLPERIRP
jgi:chorismate synthase